MKLPRSKFMEAKCEDCGSKQIVFGNPAMEVNCLVCGKLLMKPGASKPKILTKNVKVLE